jgi:hypothetical protein
MVAIENSSLKPLMGVRVIKVVMSCAVVVDEEAIEAIELGRAVEVGHSNSREQMWADIGDR